MDFSVVSVAVSLRMLLWQLACAVPSPRLTAMPEHEYYTTGQSLTLTCSFSGKLGVTGFSFSQDEKELVFLEASGQQSKCYSFPHLNVMDSGKYSCKCWRRGYAGADFKSPESNPVWIKVFDHSPPPLFSVSPKHAVYSSGEFVTFTCSAPDNRRKSKIQFFSDKRLLHLTLSSSVLVTFTHSLCLSPQDSGNYSCMYHVVEAGREIPSQRSSSIFIPVMESPPANLSLQPERPVYIHREEVTLNCSAPEGLAVEGYTFFKERREQSSSELPRRELGSYEVLHVGEDTTGNYTCVYWMLCSGQEILSPQSNLVSVAMTEPPPPPVLTMDPPSGELDEGGSLQLTCSANGSNPDRRFHFYRDGLEMASREEGSLKDSSEPGNASQGASVNILQAKPNHSGEFACRYEEESSGWWVPSPWSQTVNVTVRPSNPSTPSLGYLCLARPILTLLLPLSFYCKKSASKCLQESQECETQEEIALGNVGTVVHQTAAFPIKDSEDVTYALIAPYSAEAPPGSRMENADEPGEEEMMLYSKVLFQPIGSRAAK